jgi:RNA-directed DNA polymerase
MKNQREKSDPSMVDADIAGFFDAVRHEWLMRFVEHRIGDRRINRLVRKWLKAG